MQVRQQICLLCRNFGRTVPIIPHGRRQASQLRSLEPYDASKLVLDLDAADCKYVRRYEDQQEDHAWGPSISARNSRDEAKVRAKAQATSKKRHNPKDIPDHYRPAPIDLMRYALAGRSNVKSNAHLRKVLSKCLPPGLGKFEDHIKWLRAYEVLPYKVDQLLHVSREQSAQGIESLLRDTTKIYESSRIISLLTRTIDGCRFVASHGPIFLNSIRVKPSSDLRRQKVRGQKKLKFINSVIQKLESMGIDPGPQWYGAGLYNAMKASHCPALKKYIDIAVTRKDAFKLDIHLLQGTLEEISWPFDTTGRRCISIEDSSMRDDLLKLLTGWENFGVPNGDECRKPCFALLVQDDRAMYEAYIAALAKLEACDALWHEFNHVDLTPIAGWTSRSNDFASFERADIFVKAFIRVRDPLRALQVLHQHRRLNRDHFCLVTDQTPSKDNHPSLINQAITPSESILSIPDLSQDRRMDLRRALADKYLMEEVCDVNKGILFKDLKRLNLYTPENMSDLVRALSAYWTPTEDKKIRKLFGNHRSTDRMVHLAMNGISRRLGALGEGWESRGDISNWYMSEDLQRLKQLREDLERSILPE